MRTLARVLFLIAGVALVGVAWQSGTAQISNSRVNGLSSNLSKRIDPAKEASSEDISRILRRARLIGVVCGEDVNPQSCRFFANSLKMDLADHPVQVSLFSQPETLVQSFYVPPSLIPFTDVTLRLIEDGPPNHTRLYVGGFCFDSQAQDENGFQLPRWVQLEGGSEAGPLEADRAVAAKQLARTFSSYWHTKIVAQKTPVQSVHTPPAAAQSIEKPNQNSDADILYQHKRYSEALPLLDQGCTAGNGEACKDLGMIYGNGLGFPQDLPRAVELFSKSCNQGNARGCFDLGISYKSGKGVTQDYAHAVALFSQSCNGGDAKGCEALGLMYDLGIGVARDALHAVTLYSKACNGGDAAGCDHIKGNANNLEADAHLDKATRTYIAMLKYKAHPADLDSSFTAPQIDTVDDNKISNKTPLKGIGGQVVLVCMIEPSGTCRHWEVLKSINPEEDQAVIDGLSKVHFVPATEYGRPIAYPFFQAVTLNFGPGEQ